MDSDELEEIPPPASKLASTAAKKAVKVDDDSDESDEVEWETAIPPEAEHYVPKEPAKVSGDVQFSLEADEEEFGGFAAASMQRKQGISKAEKATRVAAHQLHVHFLLWHNAVRNRWVSDQAVQRTLLDQLPSQIRREVDKWRRASGFVAATEFKKTPKKKQKIKKETPVNARDERDWGRPSLRLEPGKADMSAGDPLISLMKVLSAYWKKRFAITAPGLRKRGYSTRLGRRKEVASYKNDPHDPERHGERIRGIKDFREVAKKCEGSRDVGAQLFTALLRGLGIESRLVASLQPAGFGATKAEEMTPKKANAAPVSKPASSSSGSDSEGLDIETINTKKPKVKKSQPSQNARGKQESLAEADSGVEDLAGSEDDSVVDVTPSLPKKRPAKYDREVPYPIYWTEAISPITSKVYPVSPLVLDKPVATNDELLGGFEPRGAKADKVKLVMAYVVAYSPDGTAKDVTVRYLRKHVYPGKTKAFRFPIEKIPVYDRTGRIKRYEDYDWFKHVMSPYSRTDAMRTAVDDVEESTDLVPQQPEKKQIDDTVDTLTSLKASPDYVLERFLRREEAVRPGAEPDRMFVSGKGDTLKEEPVYRRSDVERCLTTESWHKEGRIPKLGEVPLKRVPVRAVTLTRKREAEEHERQTGEKQLQGLYSWDQTEYIIPPPIQDGIIPKNSYGNIDAFVPSMIPKGAVHLPLKGVVRICKKLEIDFAEAVVGFEFGNKRAVPVVKGVVVAKEHEKNVKQEWKKWSEEQKRKEEMKLEKLVLDMWRKFIVGLKIRKRVQAQYGEDVEMGGNTEELPARLKTGVSRQEAIDVDDEEDGEPSAMATEATSEAADESAVGGGFFLPHSDEEMSEPDELVMEDHGDEVDTTRRRRRLVFDSEDAESSSTPASEPASIAKEPARPRKSGLRRQVVMESSEDDSDLTPPPQETAHGGIASTNGHHGPDTGSSASSMSEQTSSANDSDSDDYNPMARSKPQRTPARHGVNRPRSSGRLTRSDTRISAADNGRVLKSKVEIIVPSKQEQETPTKNGTRRSGLVTSPYFDASSSEGKRSGRQKKSV